MRLVGNSCSQRAPRSIDVRLLNPSRRLRNGFPAWWIAWF